MTTNTHRSRRRFLIELCLAAATGALTIVTLVSREWIELVFRVDPDGGSGSLEWLLVGALAVATLVFGLLARHEWAKPRAAPTRAPAGQKA